jgi:ADP-dependent NAD(P)H-hydrate dehydratase / NAD(P)H-hydrate epimerase
VTLPGWAEPLFAADEMRAADRWAIDDQGVPSLDLMERAGTGLARAAADAARPGALAVVIGKGNNGGDGLVAARLLREEGREVRVLAPAGVEGLEGDALANLERLPGEPPEPFSAESLRGVGAVVDALLGTGFEGEPREPLASAIAAVNDQEAPVVACDVPSGVNASTGEVAAAAVRARVTATFHGSKIGLHVAPGAFHAGDVRVVEIGIPRGGPSARTAGLIAPGVLDLVPSRLREGTKFGAGTVVIVGGARSLTGAPCLAALAAMRSGAGYVQLAVPESARTIPQVRLLEAMTHAMPEEDGGHTPQGVEPVLELAGRADAVALGPGLGRTGGAREFARELARRLEKPLLIDADGLNAHAGALDSLKGRAAPTILTPHAGELGRLLEIDSADVDAHRLRHAREAAERSGAIVLLKGDDTLVATPDGPVAVSPGGTPALATAGTGDALSGVIAALLAKRVEPLAAAAAGVLAHARAGRLAADRLGADHVIAGDVIDALPVAMRQ